MYRRDASGPMDVDSAHPLGRAAQYALDDDGPVRKRPHSELGSGSFGSAPSQTPAFRFGPNTPFLFHAPPMPPTPKFEPYDPSKWAGTDFGFGVGASAANHVDDVDMDGGGGGAGAEASSAHASPARPKAQSKGRQPSDAAANKENEPEFEEERRIATGAVTRAARRKRRQWKQRYDDEDIDRVSRSEHHYSLHMPSPATRHSEIPAILLGYVQFVFNGSLVVGFLYIATQFVLAVRRDVQERIEEYSVEILQEIAGCTQAYLTNRCEPQLRVPAMEQACTAWELCMNRDPKVVGRARVGAETFGGVINSFVEPISWKTMGFTLVTLSFLIVLTNSALFNLRAKHQAHAASPPQPSQQVYPPWMYHGQGGAHPGQGQLGVPGKEGYDGDRAPPREPQGIAAKALGWLTK